MPHFAVLRKIQLLRLRAPGLSHFRLDFVTFAASLDRVAIFTRLPAGSFHGHVVNKLLAVVWFRDKVREMRAKLSAVGQRTVYGTRIRTRLAGPNFQPV